MSGLLAFSGLLTLGRLLAFGGLLTFGRLFAFSGLLTFGRLFAFSGLLTLGRLLAFGGLFAFSGLLTLGRLFAFSGFLTLGRLFALDRRGLLDRRGFLGGRGLFSRRGLLDCGYSGINDLVYALQALLRDQVIGRGAAAEEVTAVIGQPQHLQADRAFALDDAGKAQKSILSGRSAHNDLAVLEGGAVGHENGGLVAHGRNEGHGLAVQTHGDVRRDADAVRQHNVLRKNNHLALLGSGKRVGNRRIVQRLLIGDIDLRDAAARAGGSGTGLAGIAGSDDHAVHYGHSALGSFRALLCRSAHGHEAEAHGDDQKNRQQPDVSFHVGSPLLCLLL